MVIPLLDPPPLALDAVLRARRSSAIFEITIGRQLFFNFRIDGGAGPAAEQKSHRLYAGRLSANAQRRQTLLRQARRWHWHVLVESQQSRGAA